MSYKNFSEKKKDKLREYNRTRYKNLSETEKQIRQEKKKKYYWNNHEELLGKNRQALNQKRCNEMAIVMSHYSKGKMVCNRCGNSDIEVLSVDHINGGGNQHLKTIGNHIASWLIKNNFPEGFQVLCMNCQCIKRRENNETVLKKELTDTQLKYNETRRNNWRQQRLMVLEYYSNISMRCEHCGFSDERALSIDHIDNDGALHRKLIGSRSIIPWIVLNDYPEGFQILCMNCQWKKKATTGASAKR